MRSDGDENRENGVKVRILRVDCSLGTDVLASVPSVAAGREAAGYAGLWTSETNHDPFLPLAVASLHTARMELGTSIAVAFARNPMTLAVVANDLHLASGGRFILGLGSQVRAHIQKRYSMPWDHPAGRMRELVLAMRAIWSCWNDGVPLDFNGDFYSHTLMTPFFHPGPNPHGPPKVFLAAVGPRMTEVAGEICDGLFVHGFTTERYLKEVTLSTVDRALGASERDRSSFEVGYHGLVVTGDTEDLFNRALAKTRQQIAFYGSTPAYRPVLELHGWGELQTELNVLSKSDRPAKWHEMGRLIDDAVLEAFAVVGEPAAVVKEIRRRFAGVVDRFSFYTPYRIDGKLLDGLAAELSREPTADAS